MKLYIRFYGNLNDFLPSEFRQITINYKIKFKTTVKDLIESIGIPHTEVYLIIINGEESDFNRIINDNDYISVYPQFFSFNQGLKFLIPEYKGIPKFVLDTHLGKLTKYLRMFGFDCIYRNNFDDEELAKISNEENRILLTRDIELLKRNRIIYGYWIRSIIIEQQLEEIIKKYNLEKYFNPFTRCLVCNGLLEYIDKLLVKDKLEENTLKFYNEFYRCNNCGNIYWKGSHFNRMKNNIEKYFNNT